MESTLFKIIDRRNSFSDKRPCLLPFENPFFENSLISLDIIVNFEFGNFLHLSGYGLIIEIQDVCSGYLLIDKNGKKTDFIDVMKHNILYAETYCAIKNYIV